MADIPLTSKPTKAGLVNADSFPIVDSEDSNAIKRKTVDSFYAQGWDDYHIIWDALTSGGSAKPTLKVFRGSLERVAFAGSGAVEELFGVIHINHEYIQGTDIHLHVHWSHIIASPSGDVVWNIDYSIAKGHDQAVFPAPTTLQFTQTAGAQYTHQIIEDAVGISGTNIEPDTILLIRLYRDSTDVGDTFVNDAYLLTVDAHIQVDDRATREKVNPFTKSNS